MTIARALAEILTWADRAIPGGRAALGLRPPAAPSALDAYAADLGVALPADVRALWSLHDGQDGEALWLPEPLLSVTQSRTMRDDLCGYVVHEWLDRTLDADPRQRDLVYHPRRVPWASSYLGDHYLHVDLAPGPAGEVGQVLILVSECDFEVVAPSVGELLDRYASLASAGAASFDALWAALTSR